MISASSRCAAGAGSRSGRGSARGIREHRLHVRRGVRDRPEPGDDHYRGRGDLPAVRGSIPGRSSVIIAPRSETIGMALDLKCGPRLAETLRSSAVRHLAEQIAEERALGERARERPRDRRRGRARPTRAAPPRRPARPPTPAAAAAGRRPRASRSTAARSTSRARRGVRCRRARRRGRCARRRAPGGAQDRLAAFLLVLGVPRALELGTGRIDSV